MLIELEFGLYLYEGEEHDNSKDGERIVVSHSWVKSCFAGNRSAKLLYCFWPVNLKDGS